jgi:AAA domain
VKPESGVEAEIRSLVTVARIDGRVVRASARPLPQSGVAYVRCQKRREVDVHFIVIFGPPAVGKMSVGRLIESATGIRLFHNHMTIEPVLNFFPFGTPQFRRLVDGFRQSLFEEVARSDLPGLCFTFVWDLDNDGDRAFLEAACRPFLTRGADISFVELRADLPERLLRNRTPERLLEKPSKRDLEQSEANLLALECKRLNSDGSIPMTHRHLIVDTNDRSSREVADVILERLDLVPPATPSR